jgi:hypothetical protein
MTVGDILNALEDYHEDTEVRIMSQESWPFENGIRGVCCREELVSEYEDEERNDPQDKDKPIDTVFIVEGGQICYGSRSAWDAV